MGWERLIIGLGCHKRNLCFHPPRCSSGTSEATSISGTALPTPIPSSGQVLPPQSPFFPFFSLWAGFTSSFQPWGIALWDRALRALWVGLGLGQSQAVAQTCRALGKTTGSFCISFGFCLRGFTVAGPALQMCAWRLISWVVLAVICISFSAVVEGEGPWCQSLPGVCRTSWSSFLCSSAWLDSYLQAFTICRAGNRVLCAVVSFSEFKGREILGVLLWLHLGQRQTNSLLWVCSKASLLDHTTAEWHFLFF